MTMSQIEQRLRQEWPLALQLAESMRSIAEDAWGPDTAHPDFAEVANPRQPGGQCYVTAMLAAHYLKVELGLPARVALGSLWSGKGRELRIPYHGWVVIGDPLEDPLIFDLTADQDSKLPRVIAGRSETLLKSGLCYQYQEVRDVPTEGSVVGRWLALMARARSGIELAQFRETPALDLSGIEDVDVRIRLDAELAKTLDPTGRRIVSACRQLSDSYSFSGTRTYPRPDHPDPDRRRSLSFLMTGILVSLRTTLENEQRAMGNVLERCKNDEELRGLSEGELAELIRPAGMAIKKARTILGALEYSEQHFGFSYEKLAPLSFEEKRIAVLGVPGFGPKAADCFLSIGLGVPTAVVDVNVFRSFHHLFATHFSSEPSFSKVRDVEYVRERVDSSLSRDPFLRQIVHTLLLLYGKDKFGIHRDGALCTAHEVCLSCSAGQIPLAVSQSRIPLKLD